eukprot:s858_g20.t1
MFLEISCAEPLSVLPPIVLGKLAMASNVRTLTDVTVPEGRSADSASADAASPQSWAKVSTPASPGKASDTSSDGSNELSYWFGKVKVPHPQQWARKFYDAGYADMDDLKATDVNLDAVFTELTVPSGIQAKIRDAVQKVKAGDAAQTSMPQGDLDAEAPVQSEDGSWLPGLFMLGIGVVSGGAAIALAGEAAVALTACRVGLGVVSVTSTVSGLAMMAGDCLDGETLVTMEDRSKKKIKDVKAGDKILSYNKNKLRVKTVVEVKEGSSNTMRELFLQGPDGKEFMIKATGGHPFYTKEKAWAVISPDDAHFDASKPVKKLAVGDTLVLRGGAGAKLVKIGEVLPTQKTYNLAIDKAGTFFVEGILSHSGLPPKK